MLIVTNMVMVQKLLLYIQILEFLLAEIAHKNGHLNQAIIIFTTLANLTNKSKNLKENRHRRLYIELLVS
jgi:competence protein ComGF